MATTYGRMRSLVLTRELLNELAKAVEPTELRFRAADLLKDYPSIADIDELNRRAPHVIGEVLPSPELLMTQEKFETELRRLGLSPDQLSPVDAVLATLPVPAGARVAFYLSRRGSLAGATPLEALARGQLEKVLNTAWSYVNGPRVSDDFLPDRASQQQPPHEGWK